MFTFFESPLKLVLLTKKMDVILCNGMAGVVVRRVRDTCSTHTHTLTHAHGAGQGHLRVRR